MGNFALRSAMYARLETNKKNTGKNTGFPRSLTDGYAKLMSPSKGLVKKYGGWAGAERRWVMTL